MSASITVMKRWPGASIGRFGSFSSTGSMSDAAFVANPWPLPERVLYPERADLHETWIDRAGTTVESVARARFPARHLFGIVDRVSTHGPRLAAMADDDLRREARALRLELRRYGLRKPAVARAFALVREVAERTIGMRHFDVQLAGGWALLEGMVAEMETGEGKTVTATLPASTAALAGIPVHVVTVNDYLARRDAEWMTPIYRFLGLGVGTVVHGTEPSERRAAYACDVTYCCNKEIAFDYLRDRLVLGSHAGNLHLKMESLSGEASRTRRLLLRGLRYAIVDEADSVLIDEARTPLILSGQSEDVDEERLAGQALALAKTLKAPSGADRPRQGPVVRSGRADWGTLANQSAARGDGAQRPGRTLSVHPR
jgi:preprotein translocase subunit SecA